MISIAARISVLTGLVEGVLKWDRLIEKFNTEAGVTCAR
jgi:hypothetical protein